MYKQMITIEDANTVLALNPHFNKSYVINTGLLPSTAFNDTYYDFCIISMARESSKYIYTLKVYNKLWDGGISFARCSTTPLVQTNTSLVNSNGEYYVMTIKSDSNDFDIILSLNNDNDSPREIRADTYYMRLQSEPSDLSYYYYEDKTVTFKVLDIGQTGVNNATVKIYKDNEVLVQGNTNSNGQVTLNLPSLLPNRYNLKVEVTKTDYSTIITYFVADVLKETPTLSVTPSEIYKGGLGQSSITLELTGDVSIDPKCRVKCADNRNGSDTTITMVGSDGEYLATYNENLRKFRGNSIILNITVFETAYTNEVNLVYTKSVDTFVATSWSELKTEAELTTGVDYIEIPQSQITAGATINLARDLELVGQLGASWCVFKNSSNSYLFKTNKELIVKNIAFLENQNGVLYGDENSSLLITNCYFIGNRKADNIGVCIKNPIDTKYQARNYFQVRINDCTFENNKGGAVAVSGESKVMNSMFIVNDWEFAQHPQPFAYHTYSQVSEVDDSSFVMSMTGRSPLPRYIHSNFSWGSKPFYIHREAYFNGKSGKQMLGHNTLNYNDNEGYIYALYEYSDDLSYWYNVCASPVQGRERKCFAHVVSSEEVSKNDGVAITTGAGNTSRRPVYHAPISNKSRRGYIE